MMVSLFPYDMTDSGIATGKNVTIKAQTVTWRAAYSFNAPVRPAAVVAPDSAAAYFLSVATVTTLAAVVSATLF
jgi:hypothetical protein